PTSTSTAAASATPTASPTRTATASPTPSPTGTGGGTVLYSENFEGDTTGWNAGSFWHLTSNTGCVSPGYQSAAHAFYYGGEPSCSYGTGTSPNNGTLTSPLIGGLYPSVSLSFWYWRQVESSSVGYDSTSVQVSYNGGASWSTVWLENSRNPSE